MSPDCEHCDQHGENTADIKWSKKKLEKVCETHDEDVEKMDAKISRRVKQSHLAIALSGIGGLIIVLLVAMFGLYDKIDGFGQRQTETRIETINRLSDIKVEQHMISGRVEDFGDRLEGLAQNQKILMRQVGDHFGNKNE